MVAAAREGEPGAVADGRLALVAAAREHTAALPLPELAQGDPGEGEQREGGACLGGAAAWPCWHPQTRGSGRVGVM